MSDKDLFDLSGLSKEFEDGPLRIIHIGGVENHGYSGRVG